MIISLAAPLVIVCISSSFSIYRCVFSHILIAWLSIVLLVILKVAIILRVNLIQALY